MIFCMSSCCLFPYIRVQMIYTDDVYQDINL